LKEGKDWLAAEKVLRKILELDPNSAEARGNLATLLQKLGRPIHELNRSSVVLAEF
jgi:Tfp pilus assembly protein PilF